MTDSPRATDGGLAVPTTGDAVYRYGGPEALADGAAAAMIHTLARRQATVAHPQLCLTGGRIANRVYARLGAHLPGSGLDTGRLELWWGDDQFVPTDDPARNAGHALALLAGSFPIASALTHPMPAADGVADNVASAATYAKELGDTVFDICLLGIGEDGHVASVFPRHPSFAPTSHAVIAVNDAPLPPAERISLSVETLSASREVWYLVSGADKAAVLARAMAGDQSLPAGVVRGRERTLWFVDDRAAAPLPYFDCAF